MEPEPPAANGHAVTAAPPADDDLLSLLRALLLRRSVTPDDAGCQELLAERLSAAGFACERFTFGKVSNLWARAGSEDPIFCFAGHTDVVPPGPASAWSSDPFQPDIRDGHIYARGAADMKGGVAAMLVAAERFLMTAGNFGGSIAFLITSDEEGPACDGTKRLIRTLAERGERIRWCVIGEPSSSKALGDTIRIGRRGSLNGHLAVNGVQGHSAYPEKADNPIARFAPVLKALCEMNWDSGTDHFPPTSFQMVQLDADGGAANVTPSSLHARFNFRYSDQWHYSELEQAFVAILEQHALDYQIEWEVSGEPFITAPGSLTDAVSTAIEAHCGRQPILSTGGGTSDGRFIAPFGAEVVELGPVNATIHKADECLKLDDLMTLARIYQDILHLLLERKHHGPGL